LSDSLSWVHGKHTVKFGGEFRRNDANAYTLSPGSFTFATIAAFLADQAIGFTANASDRSSRIFVNDLGAYMQDSYKVIPNVMLEFGLRYDWNGTPVEAESRFVEFDPATVSLVEVGRPAGPTEAYNQSALNIEPRVGFSWDLFKSGKTVLRSAYALQNDAPTTAAATPLASNPPFADPVSFSPTASVPYGSFTNAYSAAGGVVSPTTIVPNYKSDYV
jgi:outer membrane receptor protein involved in Fe transport